MLMVTCHRCVIRFESGEDATLGQGGDATFQVPDPVPPHLVCPRCKSEDVSVAWRPEVPKS